MSTDTFPIIDPKQAAESLRRIATQLETGRFHIEELSHQVFARKQWVTIKWEVVA